MPWIQQFIAELKRRRVIRGLMIWGIAAFAVLQVYEPVMHGLHLPEWTLSFVVVILGLGFPITAALAWMFDLTASGLERTAPVATPAEASGPAAGPGRARSALLLAGLGLAAAAPGLVYFFVWPGPARRAAEPGASSAPAAAQGTPSIAVLPFVNMSSDREQEYFSDGISEEILNALAQVKGLRVIGRTSSFAMKGKNEDLRTVGQRLNAANLLEGSVRRAGSKVRITAQLIETAGGSHLWSEQFDRELTDVFAVQEEIAKAVVAALRVTLLPGAAAPASARTVDAAAHDLYLRGLDLMSRGSGEDYEAALKAFEGAVERDPSYAPAWAQLSRARFWASDQGSLDAAVEWPKAVAAADRSIALAPDSADGYFARGSLRMTVHQDWTGALADLERARDLNPGNADIQLQLGALLAALGRLPESTAVLERSVLLDPLHANTHVGLAIVHTGTGKLEQALPSATRGLELAPQNNRAARTLGFVHLLAGRLPEARLAFRRSTNVLFSRMGDAMIDHTLGNTAASQRMLDAIVAEPGVHEGGCYQVAQVFAWRGETGPAFEWLNRAVDTKDAGIIYLKYDPVLKPLRADPRWRALLERLKLPLD